MYKCKKCGKKAKYNIQLNWHLYEITGENDCEDFKELKTWDGSDDDNEFFCEKCAKEEEII